MYSACAPEPSCPVLAGPTAVGKTGLVTRLASDFPIEVISLDSRQIYRGLRIGTAQPTAAEIAVCPHHLIDFLPPEERYSAQRFREDFARLFIEIRGRGSVPLLVGGAGMYLTAVTDGFFPLPDDPDSLKIVRDELTGLSDVEIRDALAAVDPESWRRITPGDRYRSQRALEISRLAGKPMSELIDAHRPRPVLGLEFPLLLLDRPRDELRLRIAERTDAMLAGGWLSETESLLESHAPDCRGLRTLGYSQVVRHLAGEIDRTGMRDEIVLRTGQYAKRQQTWFRRLPAGGGGSPDSRTVYDRALELVRVAADAPPPAA